MAYEIRVGGVLLPSPKEDGGLEESYEDIWSSNTGRDDTGFLAGTLIATKAKIKLSWNALSWEDAAIIKNAVTGRGFTTLTYPSIDGSDHTINGYFGTASYEQYSWVDGLRWAQSISVDFIER